MLSCFKINYFFKDSDSEYVNTLKSITNLPLVANLRNGLWQVSNAFIFFFHVFFFFFTGFFYFLFTGIMILRILRQPVILKARTVMFLNGNLVYLD